MTTNTGRNSESTRLGDPTERPGATWRAWVVWTAGTLAFVATMFSRTSFGVAGTAAAERFDSPIALMSTFVVVQMIVYAGMQIPAGLLNDRFGSRATIAAGTLIMAVGQTGLALASSFPAGLAARVLVGGGDALIWTSVIRLVVAWFPARFVPVLTQVSSVAGQAGQWASAVPLVQILTDSGWTTAFLTVAAGCLVGTVINLLLVRDAPKGATLIRTPIGSGGVLAAVREVAAMPGAQLGFFLHMSTAFPGLMFSLMWGFPYLTDGQGLSNEQAGQLFSFMVACIMVIGPLTGVLTNRFARRRTTLALVVVGYTVAVWCAVLLWPGAAPMPLLAALMVAVAADSPASNIAFDIARSHIPARRLSTASGMVIVGGFSAALVCSLLVSLVLNLVGGPRPGPDAYRAAMATQLPVWAFAVVMLLRARRRLIAAEAAG